MGEGRGASERKSESERERERERRKINNSLSGFAMGVSKKLLKVRKKKIE